MSVSLRRLQELVLLLFEWVQMISQGSTPTYRSCFCAIQNGVSAVGHRVNSSFYSMQDRISLLIWFFFIWFLFFFSFVVFFAISLLFTCLLSLIDDGDESRMNDVSSARDLVDLSWRHSSITSTGTVTADRRNRSIATILSNSTIQAAVTSKNRLADDVGL